MSSNSGASWRDRTSASVKSWRIGIMGARSLAHFDSGYESEADRGARHLDVDDALGDEMLEVHLERLHAVGVRTFFDEVLQRWVGFGAFQRFADGAGHDEGLGDED